MVARHHGLCDTSGGFVHGSVLHCGTQCATPSSHGNKGIYDRALDVHLNSSRFASISRIEFQKEA